MVILDSQVTLVIRAGLERAEHAILRRGEMCTTAPHRLCNDGETGKYQGNYLEICHDRERGRESHMRSDPVMNDKRKLSR